MTRDDLLALPDRDLDAVVAEKVFGWRPTGDGESWYVPCEIGEWRATEKSLLHCSTLGNPMLAVIAEMQRRGWRYTLKGAGHPDTSAECVFERADSGCREYAVADTLPRAVALAAVLAVEGGK